MAEIITYGIPKIVPKWDVDGAANFFADYLLKNKSKNIYVEIFMIKKKDLWGDCIPLQSGKKPKEFKVSINPSLSYKNTIMTLAHEMVHVKQYHTGELFWTGYSYNFHGNHYYEEDDYWENPDEIECMGREYGLYLKWLSYNKKD